MATYEIIPVPKPRQTRADKWLQRPPVMRYRAFADEVRALGVWLDNGAAITFILPMPKSWSKKKRKEMDGQPHIQRPDIDNLLKALLDALYKDDSGIWHLSGLTKEWGEKGQIIIV